MLLALELENDLDEEDQENMLAVYHTWLSSLGSCILPVTTSEMNLLLEHQLHKESSVLERLPGDLAHLVRGFQNTDSPLSARFPHITTPHHSPPKSKKTPETAAPKPDVTNAIMADHHPVPESSQGYA